MVIHQFINKWTLLLSFLFLIADTALSQIQAVDSVKEYQMAAAKIKLKYENNAYKLSPSKAGHMAMRLWRNYNDDSYKYLLLQGINKAATSLDKLVEIGLDSLSLSNYVRKSNDSYNANTTKKRLRRETFKDYPEYRLICTKILRHVARLHELGLQHKDHFQFLELLNQYDFEKVFTDEQMIRAWGAQLANQVYWLNDLGLGDWRRSFAKAVEEVYAPEKDLTISDQQFENKIYTLTHIIIAASGYYKRVVTSVEYQTIINYFKKNVEEILKRCKEDVIIEVGLCLLLTNQAHEELGLIREYIYKQVNTTHHMILSKNGNAKFSQGEHRNIIAILLLDWQGCSTVPSGGDLRGIESSISTSLNPFN